MEDFDAGLHVGPPDEPQDRVDYHDESSLGGDQPDTFGTYKRRDKLPYDREERYDEQHDAAATTTRRRPGLAKSTLPRRHSTNLALRAITREPGGRFDSFNTLPSGADGADFVAKLVLHGAWGRALTPERYELSTLISC